MPLMIGYVKRPRGFEKKLVSAWARRSRLRNDRGLCGFPVWMFLEVTGT